MTVEAQEFHLQNSILHDTIRTMLEKIRKTAVLSFTCETTTANAAITRIYAKFPEVNLHTYHYAGNNPVKYTDPTGEEIDATFEITSYEKTNYGITARGTLKITDKDTGETITVEAYSGGVLSASDGTSLPLPLGEYEVLDQAKRDGFYRLEPLDYNFGNDNADGLDPEQWNLRLHGPGATYGCLAVADRAKFNQINDMLKRTNKSQAVVDYIGRIPFKKTETIIKFGNLKVVDNSPMPNRIYEHPAIKLYPSVR